MAKFKLNSAEIDPNYIGKQNILSRIIDLSAKPVYIVKNSDNEDTSFYVEAPELDCVLTVISNIDSFINFGIKGDSTIQVPFYIFAINPEGYDNKLPTCIGPRHLAESVLNGEIGYQIRADPRIVFLDLTDVIGF